MANFLPQLSPDVIKMLTAQAGAKYVDPATGEAYYSDWSPGTQGNDMNAAAGPQFLNHIYAYDPNGGPVTDQANYDQNGNFTGMTKTGVTNDWGDKLGLLTAALVAGGGLYSAMMPGAFGGAAAGGGSGGLVGDATAIGYDPGAIATAGGGSGSATGVGGAGLGLGGGGASAPMTATSFADPAMGSAGGLVGPASSNGAFTTALSDAGASSLPSWASTALKYGLPVLGALAGSQGVKTTETSTKKMDPRMDPYVYGGNGQTGILQYAQGLLDSQMKSGLPGYTQMQNVGMGLMSQPVAGNGFNRFFPGH